jgi:hypothetical protein
MALEDDAIPDDEVAAAFHKNRPAFSGFMIQGNENWIEAVDDAWSRQLAALQSRGNINPSLDIDKTPDDGI